jgi:ribonucleoside-diphosphate reductase beta chain
VIAGYQHFLGLASRVQWDEATIDLSADAAAWPALPPEERARLQTLIAGFCVGEAGVAAHLAPFAAVAENPLAAACFRAQERDERRHEAFFARVAREVVGVAPERLREHLPAAFLELFEVRLPALARDLAAGEGDLAGAVGLYHMVLEGVVFTAGQLALLAALDDRLPGLRRGAELVLRDERWHVGFGTRCLQDARPDAGAEAAILAEGERAAALWAPEHAEHVVSTLRRRLRTMRRERVTVP